MAYQPITNINRTLGKSASSPRKGYQMITAPQPRKGYQMITAPQPRKEYQRITALDSPQQPLQQPQDQTGVIPEADYGKKKNNGGLIGGIGYVGERVGTGIVSVFEGLADYTVGGISKLFGADEFAEWCFDNDWVNYSHADEWYNPSDGWKIAGDVGSGIGTSLPTIAAAVGMTVATGGTAAPVAAKLLVAGTSFTITGVSAAGNATKEAYRSTGKLGGKEFGYGALSGVTEGTVEAASDLLTFGTGKIVTKLGKKAAGDVAETVVRKTAKQVAWDAAKNIGSDFISEGVEEMVSEVMNPVYARATYDPNAENASVEQIFYSGLIGGMSGIIMGGTSRQVNSASNFISGHKAVKNGTVGAIMDNASKIAEYEAKEASGSKLYKSIKDTYNDLNESLKATGGVVKTQQQHVQLGQLKQMVTSVPFSIEAERSVARILKDPQKYAKQFTSYGYTDASGNKLTFTEKELMRGIDMSATGKERAKQIRKALSDPNSKLASIAISDAVGHIMMDTRKFAEATMKGEHLANTATLNEFIQNATPSEKAALGADLGISDWSTATITDINNGLTNFYESGKASQVLAQRKRIDLAKKVENTKPQNLPHSFQKNMKDGVYRLSDPNGSADIAMIKVKSSYSVYDFSTGGISRTLTPQEANALLKKYWENQNSDTLTGETRHEGVESVTGADVKEFANKHIPEYKNLSVPNMRAVEMTVRQALAHGLNAEDTALLGRIAASTGVNIIFDSQKSGGRAMFDPETRTIYLHPKLKSGDMYVYLLGHELKHAVFDADTTTDKNGNKVRGKLGNRLISEAYKRIDPEDYKKTRDKYAEHYRQKNLLLSTYKPIIEEEIAAKYSEKVFRSKKAWDYILSEDPSKAENVLDFFKRAVRKYSDLSGVEKTARKFLNTYKRMFDNLQSTNARNNDILLNHEDNESNVIDKRFSLVEPFTDSKGNYFENSVLLDTSFFDGISPRNWGEKLRAAVENRAKTNPLIMPILDEQGRKQMLQFANPNERVSKNNGTSHKVISELSMTEDNISKLAVIHIDEIVDVSETNDPYYTDESTHGWLDKGGWLHRNANVINVKNGNIYNLTFDIAKTGDGRTILYAMKGKIKKVGQTEVSSLKIKGSGSHSNFNHSIHQSTQKVNSNSKNNSDINKRHALPDDSDYMSAVERGDMETAQKMVDEAAKAAGYTIKAYHGSYRFFTSFDGEAEKQSNAPKNTFFFTDNIDIAYSYTGYKEKVDLNKISRKKWEVADKDGNLVIQEDTKGGIYQSYLKIDNPLFMNFNGMLWSNKIDGKDINEWAIYAKDNGYDGFIAENIIDEGAYGNKKWLATRKPATDYVIFNSTQAKSSDPITYDDNGNVIPLSERFNRGKTDIRYALRDGAEKDVEMALNERRYTEDVFLTESSPSIIASQKGVKNLPMLMKASHIRENVFTEQEAKQRGLKVDEHTHYHGLGKDLFLRIIDGLDDVSVAYRGTKKASDTSRRENYFLLISQYKDTNGNTVNVPIYVNETGQYNRVFIETNKIATVFGRDDFQDYLQRQIQKGDLVRIKNRSIQDSELKALIASSYTLNTSNDSIHQSTEKVNSNSKNNSDINKRHALPDTDENESSHISYENLEKFNSFVHSVKLTKGQTYDIQNKVKELYEDKKKRNAKMTSIKGWIASSDDQIDTSISLNQFIKNVSGMDEKLNRLLDMNPTDAFIEFDKLYRQSIISFNKQHGIESKSEEKTGAKITTESTDHKRYLALKNRKLSLSAHTDPDRVNTVIEKLDATRGSLVKIGEEFGIYKKYNNSDIGLEFTFSKNDMDESAREQRNNHFDFAKLLSCFDAVVENAIGIKVHNGSAEDRKADNSFKRCYILASAFVDGDNIVPVKLEVKEYSDKENTLHVSTALKGIKIDEIAMQEVADNGVAQQYTPSSNMSIADFFAKINPSDESFYKHIPKKFLQSGATSTSDAKTAESESATSKNSGTKNKGPINAVTDILNEFYLDFTSPNKRNGYGDPVIAKGKINSIRQVSDYVEQKIKLAPRDKRSFAFADAAEYIIKNITVKADYGNAPDMVMTYHDTLKKYHHKFNLSSIKDEINDLGADKARTMNLLWGNNESALTPDMIKDELYEKGIHIDADNPVDIFFEISEMYELSNKILKEYGVKSFSAEEYLNKDEMNALKRNVLRLLAECIDNSKSDALYEQLQNLRLSDVAKTKKRYEKLAEKQKEHHREIETNQRERYHNSLDKQKEEYTTKKAKYKEHWECMRATTAITRYITRLKDRGAFERATGKLSDPAWKSLFGLTKGMIKNSSIVLEKAHNFTTGYLEFLQKQAPELFAYSEAMASDVENKEALYDTFVKSCETNEISSIVDPNMVATLIKIKNRVSPDSENKYPKLTLDSKELKAIGKAIASMTTLENRVDKAFYNGKWENVEDLSTQMLKEADDYRQGVAPNTESTYFGKNFSNNLYGILQPTHVMRIISGGLGTEGRTILENMAHDIQLAEERATYRSNKYYYDTIGYLFDGYKKNEKGELVKLKGKELEEYKKWANGLDTRTLKLKLTRIGFDGKTDTSTTSLTPLEAIQLLMHSKDADALDAINLGRIEFADGVRNGAEWQNRRLEGYLVDDFKATKEEIKKAGRVYIKNNAEVQAAFKDLEKQFEPMDFVFMKALEDFYNTTSKNDKRETDLRLIGKSNVKAGYYTPLARSKWFRDANLESENTTRYNNGGVNNMTFNKNRIKGANAGICVYDAISVFKKHSSELATYVEMTDSLRTFRKVYNGTATQAKRGIATPREYINRFSWSGADDYISKMFADVQHRTPRENGALDNSIRFLKQGYVKSMLAFNRGSVYKQASTLIMMTSKVSPAAWFYGLRKSNGKTMDKYSISASNRNSNEAMFAATGAMGKIGVVADVGMKAFTFGDRVVTSAMWSMCQKEVEIKSGLKIGTEENLIEAGKLLDECIAEFQDTNGMMTKTGLARSTNEFASSLAMFRSATNKMFSNVYMAIRELNALRKRGNAPKELKKKLTTHLIRLLASVIGVSLFESVVSEMVHLHNKGNDDDAGEVVQSIGKDLALNVVSIVPIVGQITESLLSEYDPSIWIVDLGKDMNKVASDVKKLSGKTINGEEIQRKDLFLPAKDAIRFTGEVLGVPTRNISNLVNAAMRRISPAVTYGYYGLFNDPKTADIKKAYDRGDEKTAQMATALIMREMKTGSSPDKLVTDEMTRLYAEGLITLPKSTPDEVKINGEAVKLKSADKQRFKEYYQRADEAALSIVKGSAYRSMTDEQKANALRYCYDIGYDLAKYSSFGIDPNKKTVAAKVIGIEKLSLAYALTKGLASDKNSAGKTIANSRKKKVLATIKGLGLIPGELALLLNTLGYSVDDNDIANLSIMRVKILLRKSLLESGLKPDELSVVADMCGFE